MYLNITPRAGGRKYLSIVHGYRDNENKVRKKTIRSLGYLDELEKDYEDPIAYFRKVAKEMDTQRKAEEPVFSLNMSGEQLLDEETDNRKNYGYLALCREFHDLRLNSFFRNKQRHSSDDFDASAVMQMLSYLKVVAPPGDSILSDRDLLFEKHAMDDQSLYDALIWLYHSKRVIQSWINDRLRPEENGSGTMIYYNIHNYCTPVHVIRVGIFADYSGMPVTYQLFPCTSNYSSNFKPDFDEIKADFRMRRMVTVSDKAILNGDNIWKIINTPGRDGYIFNLPVNSATRNLKEFVLDSSGYTWVGDDYKMKSRLRSRKIDVSSPFGSSTEIIEEKQIVFYNSRYARRAKNNIFDGYCILITSEVDEDDTTIIDTYRRLWEFQSSFHLTKTMLERRPECISVHDFIEIHLLVCFMASVLIKRLSARCGGSYTVDELRSSLSRCSCTYIDQNLYLFSYYDGILKTLSEVTGIPFNRKVMSLGDIKKVLGETKKQGD